MMSDNNYIIVRCKSHRQRHKMFGYPGGLPPMTNLFSFKNNGEFYLVTKEEFERLRPIKVTKARINWEELHVAWFQIESEENKLSENETRKRLNDYESQTRQLDKSGSN